MPKPRIKPEREPLPDYITRQELAAALNLHLESIKRLERTGKLPQPIRITPKIVRYERSVIEQFLKDARG
jgi:predicted DNA-binding transcriptional regulator AlpA